MLGKLLNTLMSQPTYGPCTFLSEYLSDNSSTPINMPHYYKDMLQTSAMSDGPLR